ncbi:MAG: cardiolipin synthase B [Cellvibrio sp. 79]|nr:MAG: cardiolipin synthase B [Cellvibrio sp. 79]
MKNNWRDNNKVDLLINGEEFYPRVFECIGNAKKEVIVETFIIYEDKVGHQLQQALIKAARNGARVEFTVDDYGTWDLSTDFVKAMTDSGVKLHIFDPQPKLLGVRLNLFRRLHRKIVVVDREIAFIGGINYSADHLMDAGKKAKQDYAVELHGPVVADVYRTCLRLSLQELNRKEQKARLRAVEEETARPAGDTKVLLVERDNIAHKKDIEQQYLLAIRLAKKRLIIANAYFFPRYYFLLSLRRATMRGVDVTLIMQGQPDMPWVSALSRLLYKYLLRSNVKIYEYHQRSLHGKIALMDDEWSTVGSSNLDPLSFSLNLEANVIIQDRDFNKKIDAHLQELIEQHCHKIDLDVAQRGYWWRVPLIFISFYFLRVFPSIAGWLPAHAPTFKHILPKRRFWSKKTAQPSAENNGDNPIKTYDKESVS